VSDQRAMEAKATFVVDESGILRRHREDNECGWRDPNGYRRVTFKGVDTMVHRIIWALVHGAWPGQQIDHINGVKDDNRIENLRLANNSENKQNIYRARVDNKAGVLGVRRLSSGRYQTRITLLGKTICVGTHGTTEAAYDAYVKAKRKYHARGML
jgi:HNH endonuclease